MQGEGTEGRGGAGQLVLRLGRFRQVQERFVRRGQGVDGLIRLCKEPGQ